MICFKSSRSLVFRFYTTARSHVFRTNARARVYTSFNNVTVPRRVETVWRRADVRARTSYGRRESYYRRRGVPGRRLGLCKRSTTKAREDGHDRSGTFFRRFSVAYYFIVFIFFSVSEHAGFCFFRTRRYPSSLPVIIRRYLYVFHAAPKFSGASRPSLFLFRLVSSPTAPAIHVLVVRSSHTPRSLTNVGRVTRPRSFRDGRRKTEL